MNKETILQRQIMIALSKEGHVCWRNETGQFWTGKPIHKDGQTVTLSGANMIPVGLCVGSSDIIGIHRDSGLFFAIEVKTENGRVTSEQKQFISVVRNNGGISGVARSIEDALNILS